MKDKSLRAREMRLLGWTIPEIARALDVKEAEVEGYLEKIK